MPARNSSTTERLVARLVPVVAATALCAAALAAAPGDTPGITPDSARLPDLDQERPWDLQVTSTGPGTAPEHRLGFASAVRNVGDGPLIVSGRREPAADTMTAEQLIESSDAPMAVVEGVGRLRYVRSRDHEHWHLLDFERYELRSAGGGSGRVTDRKTGFCLGDRYRSRDRALPVAPPAPRYTGRCGLGATGRLRLVEGISVGYGDDYPANLEGQSLPLTGLAAGRYVLVHRVNAGRRLRESYYGNNASSLLLRLRWRAGLPRIHVLRRCPDTDRCRSPVSLAGPAHAKRVRGTAGPDRIVGTAKADVIRSLAGNDRIRGRGGRDRLFGGRGADRLNAVDGRRDRAVRGGPGKDVCRVDAADRAIVKGCETVKVAKGRGPGGGPGAGLTCASPPEGARLVRDAVGRAAQEDAPPTFSDPFYGITIAINASVDGSNGDELPISIEEVCDVPTGLATEAAQLVGGEGVALIAPETKVFDAAGQELTGDAAATALAGADSVSLKARLMRPALWRQDEDGQPVPTFSTGRADITD